MGKVELNKQQKLDSLLDTAFNLFTKKGLSDTTISNIVENAGVAKGTFYLYFKDKYDLHNKLVVYKARQIFRNAFIADFERERINTEDSIHFIVDHILNQLNEDKTLLRFISKNLGWGIFINELIHPTISLGNEDFKTILNEWFELATEFDQPELLLYLIVELVSSTCYSPILYGEPVTLEELKPYLHDSIHDLLSRHRSQQKEEITL